METPILVILAVLAAGAAYVWGRAARLRLLLPLDDQTRESMALELRRLEARLN